MPIGFFLSEEKEETIEHLLVLCRSARLLSDLFLAAVGTSWVFPLTVLQTLLSWHGAPMGKKRNNKKMVGNPSLHFMDFMAIKE